MQYLSSEKDKITNKLQIAIKLIESNGLLAQLQAQINSSLAEASSQSASGHSTSKSTRGHKPSVDASCSNQNSDQQQQQQTSDAPQKIVHISASPAPISSSRKSTSSTSSASIYASPDRNETPTVAEATSPLTSIINIKSESKNATLVTPPNKTTPNQTWVIEKQKIFLIF